jgi:ribulose-5-phosphate 4-epimerase/fuculose-1-phosphate aldolase
MATAVLRISQMSESEWKARQELAACYRVFAMLGWDESIYNHITVKVPDEEDAFLINPYGLHFSEVKASNLVKIDIDGNKLDDNPYPVNLAGFVQHSVFHRHLPDAHCIAHTHTTAGMAVASLEGGLQPVNFYAANWIGQIAYHDFEGVTVRSEEGTRLIEHLGDKRAMLLRNHGILVMGRTVPEAFLKHWFALNDAELFGFAGLWRPTQDGPRYAFLTCEPNATVGRIHPKAMPVILDTPDEAARWLSVDGAEAAAMQCPLADEAMAEIALADPPPSQGLLL